MLDELGGLGRRMPITFGIFLFSGLSLAGIPPLERVLLEVGDLHGGLPVRPLAAGRGRDDRQPVHSRRPS